MSDSCQPHVFHRRALSGKTDLMSMFAEWAGIDAQQISAVCGDMYAMHRRSWKPNRGFWRSEPASRIVPGRAVGI